MKSLLILWFVMFSYFSHAQDFGYVKYTKYQSDSIQKECNIIFMFNINEKGDVISVDGDLAPTYLKAKSSYSNNNGIISFYVEDESSTKYYVTLTSDYLVLESDKSKIKFTK